MSYFNNLLTILKGARSYIYKLIRLYPESFLTLLLNQAALIINEIEVNLTEYEDKGDISFMTFNATQPYTSICI